MKDEKRVLVIRIALGALLCLAMASCGLISIGVSNSPEWCPDPQSKACQ